MQRTNRAAIAALVPGLAAAALVARAQAPHRQGGDEGGTEPAGVTAEIVQRAKGYRSWPKLSSYEQRPVLSKAHGKTHVVAWLDPQAAAAAKGGGDFPEGSTIVKENRRTPDGEPVELSVMSKRGGTWYWIKATPGWRIFTSRGKPVAGPDLPACAGCHSAAPRDMVFSR